VCSRALRALASHGSVCILEQQRTTENCPFLSPCLNTEWKYCTDESSLQWRSRERCCDSAAAELPWHPCKRPGQGADRRHSPCAQKTQHQASSVLCGTHCLTTSEMQIPYLKFSIAFLPTAKGTCIILHFSSYDHSVHVAKPSVFQAFGDVYITQEGNSALLVAAKSNMVENVALILEHPDVNTGLKNKVW